MGVNGLLRVLHRVRQDISVTVTWRHHSIRDDGTGVNEAETISWLDKRGPVFQVLRTEAVRGTAAVGSW